MVCGKREKKEKKKRNEEENATTTNPDWPGCRPMADLESGCASERRWPETLFDEWSHVTLGLSLDDTRAHRMITANRIHFSNK